MAEYRPVVRRQVVSVATMRDDTVMKRRIRWFWRMSATFVIFAGLLWPILAWHWDALTQRELYRAGMNVGVIPQSTGSYRYQVMGLNVPQPPDWAEWAVSIGTALIAVGPAIAAALAAYHWLTFGATLGDGKTRCGACANVLRGLARPQCPHCGKAI